MYRRFFKRLTDIVISFGGLLIASPVMLWVLFYIYIKTRENPFFFSKKTRTERENFYVSQVAHDGK